MKESFLGLESGLTEMCFPPPALGIGNKLLEEIFSRPHS